MTNSTIIAFLAIFTLAAQVRMAAAEPLATANGLQSNDWHARQATFDSLRKQADGGHNAGKMGSAITSLLLREARNNEGVYDDEAYSEYFESLIACVASLGTVEAGRALLEPEVLGTGRIARSGISRIGHDIVPDVIARYDAATRGFSEGPHHFNKQAADLVLLMNELLRHSLTVDDRAEIEARLLLASTSPSALTRSAAIDGLASLRDAAAVARLREINATDPRAVSGPSGNLSYPLRQKAGDMLKKINSAGHD